MLRAGSVFPTPGKASASGSPETQPCPASSKGKVLRKFLVLPVIPINYVLKVFICPCSSSWSSEDSVPCSRGAPGLDSFLAGVRFPILCKGEISRGGAFKPHLLVYTHFVLGRFFSWNTVNFSIGICENKGARVCVLLGGAQCVSWHPWFRTAGAGTWPWAHKRQTGDGNASSNSYSNSRKHLYPTKIE